MKKVENLEKNARVYRGEPCTPFVCVYLYSHIIRHILPISTYPLLGSGFLLMNNKQLLVIKHLLSVKHPVPSCGDRGIGT